MAGKTSRFNIPFPTGGDQIWKGAEKIEELATRVDAVLDKFDRRISSSRNSVRDSGWSRLSFDAPENNEGDVYFRVFGQFGYLHFHNWLSYAVVSPSTPLVDPYPYEQSMPEANTLVSLWGEDAGRARQIVLLIPSRERAMRGAKIEFYMEATPQHGGDLRPYCIVSGTVMWPI